MMTTTGRTGAVSGRAAMPLFTGADWNFETMDRVYEAVADIALNDLGLDVYPNQIEVISFDQMLDAYASNGLPLIYPHWSFGKRFARESQLYQKGYMGLAYEIVINSSPCISYNMEENSMAMQTLVMAHAAFGHNHFFKNNYLFRQWTDAEGILDYLDFAKRYVEAAEERHGQAAVEQVLDAAHALMSQGVFRYRRPPKANPRAEEERKQRRLAEEQAAFNDLWRTVPKKEADELDPALEEYRARHRELRLPQENLLYFLEKFAPKLAPWQRELIRIVRTLAQYFYPQKQTKVMNEGCATFVHYYIANRLYDLGLITEGALLEILHSHSQVIFQPAFDDPRYNGLNPYALGFAMMEDIRRIVTEPSSEDRQWFPEIAGSGDWRAVLKEAWANYRDESFILQYLSPHLIRKMRLFHLVDDAADSFYAIAEIHNEDGYRQVRQALAAQYDLARIEPDIQVTDADLKGARTLHLKHTMLNGVELEARNRDMVLRHLRNLWGYDVVLDGIASDTGETLYTAEDRFEKSAA